MTVLYQLNFYLQYSQMQIPKIRCRRAKTWRSIEMSSSTSIVSAPETTNPKRAQKAKASFYGVGVYDGRFECCVDLLTNRDCGTITKVENNPRCDVDGWTIQILKPKKLVTVTYRPSPMAPPVISGTVPLCYSTLYLYHGLDGTIKFFADPVDVKGLLREFGVTSFRNQKKIEGDYAGDWVTKFDENGVVTDQGRFWLMTSGGVNQPPLTIDQPHGDSSTTVVLGPHDEALLDYNGEVSCHLGDDNPIWMAICTFSRTPAYESSTVELYLKEGVDLDEIYKSVKSFLAAKNYTRFDDCFSVPTS